MHVLTQSYILIYVLSVKVDTWFVPTAAELRGIVIKIIYISNSGINS